MKGSSRSARELHQHILGAFASAYVCPPCCFDAAMVSKCLLAAPREEHTCDSGCSRAWEWHNMPSMKGWTWQCRVLKGKWKKLELWKRCLFSISNLIIGLNIIQIGVYLCVRLVTAEFEKQQWGESKNSCLKSRQSHKLQMLLRQIITNMCMDEGKTGNLFCWVFNLFIFYSSVLCSIYSLFFVCGK